MVVWNDDPIIEESDLMVMANKDKNLEAFQMSWGVNEQHFWRHRIWKQKFHQCFSGDIKQMARISIVTKNPESSFGLHYIILSSRGMRK
jgi:hypothetical protein